jgi:hypothetical protein
LNSHDPESHSVVAARILNGVRSESGPSVPYLAAVAYNLCMIETLYKTDRPQKEHSECYVLVLTPRPASNGRRYSFMEEHGRWDASMGHFLYEVIQIVTEEEMTYDDAWARYKAAKQNLSEKGFLHSFGPGCLPKEPKTSRIFEFEAATA